MFVNALASLNFDMTFETCGWSRSTSRCIGCVKNGSESSRLLWNGCSASLEICQYKKSWIILPYSIIPRNELSAEKLNGLFGNHNFWRQKSFWWGLVRGTSIRSEKLYRFCLSSTNEISTRSKGSIGLAHGFVAHKCNVIRNFLHVNMYK